MSVRKPPVTHLGQVEINLRTPEASNAIFDAALEAIREGFEEHVLPDARANSPVGDEPVRPGSRRNRDSLEVKSFGTKRGPFAKIYSTSGHGGFLEVGTRKMGAQPYIYPALSTNLSIIFAKIREKIRAVRSGGQPAAELGRVLPEE